MTDLDDTPLKRTALYDFHVANGAKMVPFAGYDMPVQYAAGVMKEHLATRAEAGLFDVSHMGQVNLRPKSGNIADAALALESLIPMDVLGLAEGRQRYGFFTNDKGGILDDLMFANRGDHLFLVVNAACKEADIAHMRAHLGDRVEVEVLEDRALVALQGPRAEAALAQFAPGVADMNFMDVAEHQIMDAACIVSRSGYSGEDGFEISIPADRAAEIAGALASLPDVSPVGLGARDSLRLEAGLCLYGNDIDETTTPVMADLRWAMQKARRRGGAREGGFPGAAMILDEMDMGAPRKRVGLRPDGRAPMRDGTELFADETSTTPIGRITSGGFGPTIGGPVSMAYLHTEHAEIGTEICAELRGKRIKATVTKMPFVTPNYKRS